MSVYVSIDGKVSLAIGEQPKDALLFAPTKKSSAQVIREQRDSWKRNNQMIKDRFEEATRRH
ncbi:MAG: hypothetical protein K0Q81_428 [Paenibacillus sp.]|jgi:hypothetical protein|nr:hypothetical protein [Paenibacillus sp.]